jgi:bifunctional DNA-binding transcriptional regulator/antitoxin component of YhaV-PrlF toxin-antitoxin module
MIVTLDSKRRLTLPSGVTSAKPGDHFLVDVDAEEDAVIYRRVATEPDWLEVLKACPASMDDLPPRRREYFRSRL